MEKLIQYQDALKNPLKQGVYNCAGKYVYFDGKFSSSAETSSIKILDENGKESTLQPTSFEHLFPIDISSEIQRLNFSVSFLEKIAKIPVKTYELNQPVSAEIFDFQKAKEEQDRKYRKEIFKKIASLADHLD